MSKIAIKAENISKQYRLGEIGTGTISHDLNRWWHKLRGNEDPYLKIGESNDHSQKGATDYVWSLKDINFEINQGDTVGIIGRNGAGKSTLLKLLSKVTKPSTGQFKVNGRIASLLEVGTGFHPEMTGRENIYLNGAILGMHRSEITRKFDEIVDFAGIELYIETPVKRYSSGMYVRLAFAVAAHLESEILIVDEVLAVGDAEFQKKCLGKMGDVSIKEGRTVLFVSHNILAVKQLCKSGIFLENGTIKAIGEINSVINHYTNNNEKEIRKGFFNPFRVDEIGVIVNEIKINSDPDGLIKPFQPLRVEIEIIAKYDIDTIGLQIMISSDNIPGIIFLSNSTTTNNSTLQLKEGSNFVSCVIDSFCLASGKYWLGFGLDMPHMVSYHYELETLKFEVAEDIISPRQLTTSPTYGLLYMDNKWEIQY